MDPGVLIPRPLPEDREVQTRRCSQCERVLPLSSFAHRSTRERCLQRRCRECMAKYHAQWYAKNRANVMDRVHRRKRSLIRENRQRILAHLRAHPCADCGEADPIVLEFDHLRDKRAEVSELVRAGVGWRTIQHEIDKCEVRCVNCHKRATFARARAKARGEASGLLV